MNQKNPSEHQETQTVEAEKKEWRKPQWRARNVRTHC